MKKLRDQIAADSQALQKVNLDFSKQTGQLNDNIKELDKIASDNKASQTVILILNKQIDQLNDKIKELRDQIAAQPKPNQSVIPGDENDCFNQMLKLVAQEAKLPEFKWLQDSLAIVEQRTGKSVRDHVGFGKIQPGELKFFRRTAHSIIVGELHMSNNIHGRGIKIELNEELRI